MKERKIYVMTFDDLHYKIGSTNDVDARQRSLQTAAPYALKVLRYFPASNGMEKHLHNRFWDNRTHGEWFKFSEDPVELISQEVEKFIRKKVIPRVRTVAPKKQAAPKQYNVMEKELITRMNNHFILEALEESFTFPLKPFGRYKELAEEIKKLLDKKTPRAVLPGIGMVYPDYRIKSRNKRKWALFSVDLIDADYRLTDEAEDNLVGWKTAYLRKARADGIKPGGITIGGGVTNFTDVLLEDRDKAIEKLASVFADEKNLRPPHWGAPQTT